MAKKSFLFCIVHFFFLNNNYAFFMRIQINMCSIKCEQTCTYHKFWVELPIQGGSVVIEKFHGISDIIPEFLLLSVEHFCLVVHPGLAVVNHDDIDIDEFCRCWFTYQFFIFLYAHMYVVCVCVCVGMEVRKRGKKTNIHYYNKFPYFTRNFSQKR